MMNVLISWLKKGFTSAQQSNSLTNGSKHTRRHTSQRYTISIPEQLAEKELNRVYANLRKAKSKGIGLTIGSDSFCSSLTPYGTTAIGEMYSFVEKAGISEMDTIVAATKVGAEMLKVDTITGTLEVDKFADILVLDGNPLENIRAVAVNNMKIITKEGTIIKQ